MNELALFAGAGGGLLASRWLLGWRTVCYVEREGYCVDVLKARMRDGLLDDAPIWDDVRTFDGRPWRGCVDIVTAGFPCQPFSVAGKGEAGGDCRNGWPDTVRIVREVRPEWVFLENVPGLLAGRHGYFGTVLGELAESGYDARWKVLSAAEVGAAHKRDRVWIVAHSDGAGGAAWGADGMGDGQQGGDVACAGGDVAHSDGGCGQRTEGAICPRRRVVECCSQDVAYADGVGCGGSGVCVRQPGGTEVVGSGEVRRGCEMADTYVSDENGRGYDVEVGWERCQEEVRTNGAKERTPWSVEPDVGRVVDGVAFRVERIRALGNGQVPAVAATAWHLLTGGWFDR